MKLAITTLLIIVLGTQLVKAADEAAEREPRKFHADRWPTLRRYRPITMPPDLANFGSESSREIVDLDKNPSWKAWNKKQENILETAFKRNCRKFNHVTKKLDCQVNYGLSRKGEIINYRFLIKSSDQEFNQIVHDTLEQLRPANARSSRSPANLAFVQIEATFTKLGQKYSVKHDELTLPKLSVKLER